MLGSPFPCGSSVVLRLPGRDGGRLHTDEGELALRTLRRIVAQKGNLALEAL